MRHFYCTCVCLGSSESDNHLRNEFHFSEVHGGMNRSRLRAK